MAVADSCTDHLERAWQQCADSTMWRRLLALGLVSSNAMSSAQPSYDRRRRRNANTPSLLFLVAITITVPVKGQGDTGAQNEHESIPISVVSGPCESDANCISRSAYADSETCTFTVGGTFALAATSFNTEASYDILTVDDVSYSGQGIAFGPECVPVTPASTITWVTDSSVTNIGWTVCVAPMNAETGIYDCISQPCPTGSTGAWDGASGCEILPGYSGTIVSSTSSPYYTSSLVAASCPAGSTGTVPGNSGTGGSSGCTLAAGYSGIANSTTELPYYSSSVSAVPCPFGSTGSGVPGTSGTDGTSNCTTSAGFTGAVVATTSTPYFTSTLEATFIGEPCTECDPCSPCLPAGPDGVVMVAPTVESSITLAGDIATIGAEGSASYNTFKSSFEADMASNVGVEASRVELTTLSAGSIAAGFTVAPSATGVPFSAAQLTSAFSAPGVSLGGMSSSSVILLRDIAETAAACNSPAVMDIAVDCTTYLVDNAEQVHNLTLHLQASGDALDTAAAGDSTAASAGAEDVAQAQAQADAATAHAEQSQAMIDAIAVAFCNSTCAVTLTPKWLSCNRGLYMAAPLQLGLAAPAILLNGFCGLPVAPVTASDSALAGVAGEAAEEAFNYLLAAAGGSMVVLAASGGASVIFVRRMRKKIPGWMPFSTKQNGGEKGVEDKKVGTKVVNPLASGVNGGSGDE